MYELPISIEVNGREYKIRNRADYRMILSCFDALNDEELTPYERTMAALIIFYEDFNELDDVADWKDLDEGIQKMYDFFNCNQPEIKQSHNSYNLIDWNADANLICSAINVVAQKEIRAEKYMHWFTFFGYYMAIGECVLTSIITIRYKIASGTKLEKHEQKFKEENPQYFTRDMRSIQDKDDDEWLRQMWNSNS